MGPNERPEQRRRSGAIPSSLGSLPRRSEVEEVNELPATPRVIDTSLGCGYVSGDRRPKRAARAAEVANPVSSSSALLPRRSEVEEGVVTEPPVTPCMVDTSLGCGCVSGGGGPKQEPERRRWSVRCLALQPYCLAVQK